MDFMPKLMRWIFALLLAIGVVACEQEGPMEEAGEEMGETMDETGENIGEAVEDTEQEIQQ
ncbi:MAG: hypothetical protein RQ736_07705 [Thiogranum sp.]|nr:hypothetical protein [Thiogranum sp.]